MKKFRSIAIDGPAGAGKSDISDILAKKLNFVHVDTGALYRAVALCFLGKSITEHSIDIVLSNSYINVKFINNTQLVYLNGENVNGLIRTEEVGNMASASSVNGDVRKKLVELQQKLASEADVVMDGRDIGTVVLPDADVKVYLTASSKVRAERRFKELTAKGEQCDIDKIEQDIIDRDYRDMHREISPLKQADGAILVDSSDMTIDEVADAIIGLYKDRHK